MVSEGLRVTLDHDSTMVSVGLRGTFGREPIDSQASVLNFSSFAAREVFGNNLYI